MCDDGDGNNSNDCTNACLAPVCGDGFAWTLGSGTEQCDDGGVSDGDGCSATCQSEPSQLPLLRGPMGWFLALLLMAAAASVLRRKHRRATGQRL